MATRDVDHLLIGGGIAAGNCARQLRRGGADGTITLVGRERDLPYDRPPLSKEYLRGTRRRADALMEDAGWYEDNEVETLTGVTVTGLDLGARMATLSNREVLRFSQALIATGANVRRLPAPGAELEGIHHLRTFGNSDAIREDASGKRVVLIGGSYIACEVAASLTTLGSTCTLVMQEALPLSRGFGSDAGRFFAETLGARGIGFSASDELEGYEGADGRVTHVITRSGARLEADAVIVGAGVNPDIALARAAGLEIGKAGGIVVDSRLRTAAEGVYAAGDVAEYVSIVNDPPAGRRQRVEHWDVAFSQGRTVARNMLGRNVEHDVVPYFFSDLADWAAIEYVGPAYAWDREIVRGSLEEGEFTIFYLRAGVVQGALTVGRSNDLQTARRLIASGTELGDAQAQALGDLGSDLEQLG
ncbi:MAG TPA: FAD-dependent oxidoreductase [Solirubrobacteraceae bacterium]|nr:FAD-dependent oxidoreductase [Solirubrobacteraceae bacterium]